MKDMPKGRANGRNKICEKGYHGVLIRAIMYGG